MASSGVPKRDAPGRPRIPRPRFSVIVPAFNEEAVLARCLDALAAQTFEGPIEVIVVDNASTDGTADLAKRCGARVVHEPQAGVCYARQRGLAAARGEIVVTTDADTVCPPGWLQEIDGQFRRRSDAVAVAGPCVYVDGPWWSEAWTRLLFGLVALLTDLTGRVFYVTATNLAFYRTAFSGYDTRLTQGGDELDVLRRLRSEGQVVFVGTNPTYTSARRLERGLLYSMFVSLCFQYLLGYVLNRVARRPVVRGAPAFRASGSTALLASHAEPTAATGSVEVGGADQRVVAATQLGCGHQFPLERDGVCQASTSSAQTLPTDSSSAAACA